MFTGQLEAIYITAQPTDLMRPVPKIEAIAGKGLEGDRYFTRQGTFWDDTKDDREVTLIEAEAIEAACREYDVYFTAAETRRNLVTRGVPLNHLVGKEFTVGTVKLRGMKLCEPCGHLEKVTACSGIRKSLIHRGGLRAKIITGGTVTSGDAILPAK